MQQRLGGPFIHVRPFADEEVIPGIVRQCVAEAAHAGAGGGMRSL